MLDSLFLTTVREKARFAREVSSLKSFWTGIFPTRSLLPDKIENAKADAASIAGFYISSRRFETSFLKLTSLLGEEKVFANSDGTISIDPSSNGPEWPTPEVRRDWPAALSRSPWTRSHRLSSGTGMGRCNSSWTAGFHFPEGRLLGKQVLQLRQPDLQPGCGVLTLVLWPVGALDSQTLWPSAGSRSAGAQAAAWRAVGLHPLHHVFCRLAGGSGIGHNDTALNALPPWIVFLGILGVLCACGAVLACVNAFRSWSAPNRWIWTKLHDTALALACVGLVWFAITWNLMNFNIHY